VLVVPIIETINAARQVPQMCRVDGVELLWFGPADYSSTAGYRGQWEGPGVAEQILQMKDQIRAAGRHCGLIATSVDNMLERKSQGFRAIVSDCVNSRQAIMAAQRPYPEWNDLVVIAHGNRLIHAINGVMTLQVVDDDPRAVTSGQFGLQIHRDLIMSSAFRNIAVRELDAMPDLAGRFVTDPRPTAPDGTCT
jgi:hypothetical protein